MKAELYLAESHQKQIQQLLEEASAILQNSKKKISEYQLVYQPFHTISHRASIPPEWARQGGYTATLVESKAGNFPSFPTSRNEEDETDKQARKNSLPCMSPGEKLLSIVEQEEQHALVLLQKCAHVMETTMDGLRKEGEALQQREDSLTAAKASMEVFFVAQAEVLSTELNYFQDVLSHEQQRSFHRLQLLYARLCWNRRCRILKECLQHWRQQVSYRMTTKRRILPPPPASSSCASSLLIPTPPTPSTTATSSPFCYPLPPPSVSSSLSWESFRTPTVDDHTAHRIAVHSTAASTRSRSSDSHSRRSVDNTDNTTVHRAASTETEHFQASKCGKEKNSFPSYADQRRSIAQARNAICRRSGTEDGALTAMMNSDKARPHSEIHHSPALPTGAVGHPPGHRKKVILFPSDYHSRMEIMKMIKNAADENCDKRYSNKPDNENTQKHKKHSQGYTRRESESMTEEPSSSTLSSSSTSSTTCKKERRIKTASHTVDQLHSRRSSPKVSAQSSLGLRSDTLTNTSTTPSGRELLPILSTLPPGVGFTVRVVEEGKEGELLPSILSQKSGEPHGSKPHVRGDHHPKGEPMTIIVSPREMRREEGVKSTSSFISQSVNTRKRGTYQARRMVKGMIQRVRCFYNAKEARLRHKLYMLEMCTITEYKERKMQSKLWRTLFSSFLSHIHALCHQFLYIIGQKEVLLVASTAAVASQVVENYRHQCRMTIIVAEQEREQEKKLQRERKCLACQTLENMQTAKYEVARILILVGKKFFFQWMSRALQNSHRRSITRGPLTTKEELNRYRNASSSSSNTHWTREGEGVSYTEGDTLKGEATALCCCPCRDGVPREVLQLQLLEEEERTKRMGVYLGYFSWCVGWMQRQVAHLHQEFLPTLLAEKQALALVCTEWEAHFQVAMITHRNNLHSYQERVSRTLQHIHFRQAKASMLQLLRLHFQRWWDSVLRSRTEKFLKRQGLIEKAAQREKHTLFAAHLIQCKEDLHSFHIVARRLEQSAMNAKRMHLAIQVKKLERNAQAQEQKMVHAASVHFFLRWAVWARGKRVERMRFRQNIQELLWEHQGQFETCLRRKVDEAVVPSFLAFISQHKEDKTVIEGLKTAHWVAERNHQAEILQYEKKMIAAESTVHVTLSTLKTTQDTLLTTQQSFAHLTHEFDVKIVERWSLFLHMLRIGNDRHTKMITTIFTDAVEALLREKRRTSSKGVLLSYTLPPSRGSAAFLAIGRQTKTDADSSGGFRFTSSRIKQRASAAATSSLVKRKRREGQERWRWVPRLEQALAIRACQLPLTGDTSEDGKKQEPQDLWSTYLRWSSADLSVSLAYEWEVVNERLHWPEDSMHGVCTRKLNASNSYSDSFTVPAASGDHHLVDRTTCEESGTIEKRVGPSPFALAPLRLRTSDSIMARTSNPCVPPTPLSSFSVPFFLCKHWTDFVGVVIVTAVRLDHEKENLWRWTLGEHLRELVDKRERREYGVQYDPPLHETGKKSENAVPGNAEEEQKEEVARKEEKEDEKDTLDATTTCEEEKSVPQNKTQSTVDLAEQTRIVRKKEGNTLTSTSNRKGEGKSMEGGRRGRVRQGCLEFKFLHRDYHDTRSAGGISQTEVPCCMPNQHGNTTSRAPYDDEEIMVKKKRERRIRQDGEYPCKARQWASNEVDSGDDLAPWDTKDDMVANEKGNRVENAYDATTKEERDIQETESWKLNALQQLYTQLQTKFVQASQMFISQREHLFFLFHLLLVETEKSQRFHIALDEEHARWEYTMKYLKEERRCVAQLYQRVTSVACARFHGQGLRWKEMYHQRMALDCSKGLSDNRTMRTHIGMLEDALRKSESSQFFQAKELAALQLVATQWKAKFKCWMAWVEESLFSMEETQRRKVSWFLRSITSRIGSCGGVTLPQSSPLLGAATPRTRSPLPPPLSVLAGAGGPTEHPPCLSPVSTAVPGEGASRATRDEHRATPTMVKCEKRGEPERPFYRAPARASVKKKRRRIEEKSADILPHQRSLPFTSLSSTAALGSSKGSTLKCPTVCSYTIPGETCPLAQEMIPSPLKDNTSSSTRAPETKKAVSAQRDEVEEVKGTEEAALDSGKERGEQKMAEELLQCSSSLSHQQEMWMQRLAAAENFRARLTEIQDKSDSLLRLVDASDKIFSTFS